MQGTPVGSLVWEIPHASGKLNPGTPSTEPVPRACALHQGRPPRQEDRGLTANPEKPEQREDPAQAEKDK